MPINSIKVYPYKGCPLSAYAAVNQVTDIALEPGEVGPYPPATRALGRRRTAARAESKSISS
jgi:hypothetical protein